MTQRNAAKHWKFSLVLQDIYKTFLFSPHLQICIKHSMYNGYISIRKNLSSSFFSVYRYHQKAYFGNKQHIWYKHLKCNHGTTHLREDTITINIVKDYLQSINNTFWNQILLAICYNIFNKSS